MLTAIPGIAIPGIAIPGAAEAPGITFLGSGRSASTSLATGALSTQNLMVHSANFFIASSRSGHLCVRTLSSRRAEAALHIPMSLGRFSRYEKVAGVAQDSAARARQSPQLSAA